MNRIILLLVILQGSVTFSIAQEDKMTKLPYHQIPDYPSEYSPCNAIARMVDGLGYRYYWATEGLRDEDLTYKPSEKGRTTLETLEHIHGLTSVLVNATRKEPNIRSSSDDPLSFKELRVKTLQNIKEASDILKSSSQEDLDEFIMEFKREDGSTKYPFWNMLNGPLADAISHVGQVVSFRRSSGNPIHPGVRVLLGKTTE